MTASGTVDLIARFKAKPGFEEALLEAMGTLVAETLKEEGCERFELYHVRDDRGSMMLIERFRDQAAFDAHMESHHVKRFLNVDGTSLIEERSTVFYVRLP